MEYFGYHYGLVLIGLLVVSLSVFYAQKIDNWWSNNARGYYPVLITEERFNTANACYNSLD